MAEEISKILEENQVIEEDPGTKLKLIKHIKLKVAEQPFVIRVTMCHVRLHHIRLCPMERIFKQKPL